MTPSTGQPHGAALHRRLSRKHDALDLYRALTGDAADTMLFEGNRGTSLLMASAALRIECRGWSVALTALSPDGESLLTTVKGALADRVTGEASRRIDLQFDPPESLDADVRLRAPAPLHVLRPLLAMGAGGEAFDAAVLGIVGFDHAALGEDMPDSPSGAAPSDFPDYVFWVPNALILFEAGAMPRIICTVADDADPARAARNHHDAAARLADLFDRAKAAPASPPQPINRGEPQFQPDLDDEAYADVVRRMKDEIASGEVYQIVPSRTFRAPCPDPLAAFAALRSLEPASYLFYARGDGWTLFGASPETSVRVDPAIAGPLVEVRPIAGTRPRGVTADEDDRLEAELRLDHKETAEHMMLVDLARNDVARISVAGTRRVAALLTVERYARVMHLVSSVTGTLNDGHDALDALAACLNVGTLTGAPKIRAMQLLRQTERTRRGPYGGAIGWIGGGSRMDTAVVIRSALVRDGEASVRAGAGVVHDSDPIAEADETKRKASALLSILAGAAT